MPNVFNNPYLIGYLPDVTWFVYTTTWVLNAADTWKAVSFVAPVTDTLDKVKRQISSVTGTLGVSDLTCTLYSDSSGKPGSALQVVSKLTSAPSADEWIEFGGFTYSLAKGTRYWLVFKNVNGSPASNYPTFKSAIGAASYAQYVNDYVYGRWGHASASSTNAGSSWTVTPSGEMGTCRIEFGDGGHVGLGIESQSAGLDAEDKVYGVRQIGAKFTTPKGPVLNIIGVSIPILKHGSPTVNPVVKVYLNDTLITTSLAVPSSNIIADTLDYTYFLLPSNITVNPGGTMRVVLAEPSNSDASTDYYAIPHLEVENAEVTLALKPVGGTLQHCLWDGYEWTDTPASIVPFGLVLDPDTPFTAETEQAESSLDFSESGNSQYLAII